jgi:hypothetical protein
MCDSLNRIGNHNNDTGTGTGLLTFHALWYLVFNNSILEKVLTVVLFHKNTRTFGGDVRKSHQNMYRYPVPDPGSGN